MSSLAYVMIPITKRFHWREFNNHVELWQNQGTENTPTYVQVWSSVGASGGGDSTAHKLLDGAVDNDTLLGSVIRGDIIIGNSTPKWARLPAGARGNVPTINTAGDVIWNAPAALSNPVGTGIGSYTPATGAHLLGINSSFTPARSGYCIIVVTGWMQTSTDPNSKGQVQIYYGNGVYPGQGGTPTNGGGVAAGPVENMGNIGNTTQIMFPIVLTAFVSLAAGTAYWLDAANNSTIPGAFSFNGNPFFIFEL